MSINAYVPHVLVIPEDDANRQIANGFVLEVENGNRIQVLPEVGGWINVYENFLNSHVEAMRNYPERRIILLFDFDNRDGRRAEVEEKIPEDLKSRVFILGVKTEPEDLRSVLGNFEKIGVYLGAGCRDNNKEVWGNDLLNNNLNEIIRLELDVRNILF